MRSHALNAAKKCFKYPCKSKVASRAWHKSGQPLPKKSRRSKKEPRGAVAKGTFGRMDHEAVAVAAQALERQRRPAR